MHAPYFIVKGKCKECFNELMSKFPKDINYIRNQVLTEQKQPKQICLQIIVGNQVLVICKKHFHDLEKLFDDKTTK